MSGCKLLKTVDKGLVLLTFTDTDEQMYICVPVSRIEGLNVTKILHNPTIRLPKKGAGKRIAAWRAEQIAEMERRRKEFLKEKARKKRTRCKAAKRPKGYANSA